MQAKHKGTTSYMDHVEEHDPSYLHQMYRYATTILGDSATFKEITRLMAEKSAAEEDVRTQQTESVEMVQETRWKRKIVLP